MKPGEANLGLESTPPVDALVPGEIVNRGKEVAGSPVEEVFYRLVSEWKTAVTPLSSTTARVHHPAYQKIIALGQAAVPLLLRELDKQPNHWFAALGVLTGADPVAPADRGKIGPMTEAWLRWGKEHGYS